MNTKRNEAKVQNVGVDFDSSKNGATHVPVNIAIKFEQALQKDIQSAIVIVDNRANDKQEYNLHFKNSGHIVFIHAKLQTDMKICL